MLDDKGLDFWLIFGSLPIVFVVVVCLFCLFCRLKNGGGPEHEDNLQGLEHGNIHRLIAEYNVGTALTAAATATLHKDPNGRLTPYRDRSDTFDGYYQGDGFYLEN